MTALKLEAAAGNLDTANDLLDAGAEVNAKINRGGWTALMSAVFGGNDAIVERLLNADADVHAQSDEGITALMQAAARGHNEMVKRLLKAGADVNAKDKKDMTPAIRSVLGGHGETASILIDAGADQNMNYCGTIHDFANIMHEGGIGFWAYPEERS